MVELQQVSTQYPLQDPLMTFPGPHPTSKPAALVPVALLYTISALSRYCPTPPDIRHQMRGSRVLRTEVDQCKGLGESRPLG
jgi:hypothetical protein